MQNAAMCESIDTTRIFREFMSRRCILGVQQKLQDSRWTTKYCRYWSLWTNLFVFVSYTCIFQWNEITQAIQLFCFTAQHPLSKKKAKSKTNKDVYLFRCWNSEVPACLKCLSYGWSKRCCVSVGLDLYSLTLITFAHIFTAFTYDQWEPG